MGAIASSWAWRGLVLFGVFGLSPSRDEPPESTKLSVTKPVLCKEIRGYEDFDKRSDEALARDEKLLVYFRPLHYEEKALGSRRQVHFTQEGRIRKRGQKNAVWTNKELLDFKKTFQPPASVYLDNTVSLKELKPGDYEYEIKLTDKVGGQTVTCTVDFRIIEPKPNEPAESRSGKQAAGSKDRSTAK
jgi:hypothetical protein